jgi:GTPase SAR1 family protein
MNVDGQPVVPDPFAYQSAIEADSPRLRKPRIALMGEFSAGKSTLANLLVEADRLPVQVTATQLPPIWISHGRGQAHRVDLDGKTIPVSLARIADVPLAETAYVRLFQDAQILSSCDIIDMPGVSDPNMPPAVWQRILPMADGILWCTHATQAWRQSESAIWSTLAPAIQRRSLLLLTRIDKILGDNDRQRIIRRLRHETDGLFAESCLPISLTRARAGRSSAPDWTSSGAEALLAAIDRLIAAISKDLGAEELPTPTTALPAGPAAPAILPRRIRSEAGFLGATPRPPHMPDDPRIATFRAMARSNRG